MTARPKMFAIAVLILNAACGSGASAVPEVQASASDEAGSENLAETRTVSVHWGEAAVTSGCFYFSGPPTTAAEIREPFGEAALLSRTPQGFRLSLGGTTYFHGSPDEMSRTASYTYGGKWHITETLRFTAWGELPWSGEYSYQECEEGGACPGHCTLRAPVRITSAE